jgi:hypothetical protein
MKKKRFSVEHIDLLTCTISDMRLALVEAEYLI